MSNDPSQAPAAPMPLVSLRERRTQVIADLSHAFARNDLDLDELDRRMEVAHRALTVAELDALVADVPGATLSPLAGESKAITVRSLTSGLQVGVAAHRADKQTMVAMMGGVQRTGRWLVPNRLSVHCLMGGVSLDFREADLAPGVTELHVTCWMGGVEIIVPPDLNVEVAGSAILGGFDQEHPGADGLATDPIATLRITGVAFAGGVGVETRRIGESGRQARKRIKNERKQLEGGSGPRRGQAALPPAVVLPERKKR